MERTSRVGAAVAALFTMLVLPAQESWRPVTAPAFRLAQAKLAEARGNVALARETLEAALAQASESEQGVLREALSALPQVATGKDQPSEKRIRELLAEKGLQQQDPKTEPVQQLIAVLERGSQESPEVLAAVKQLQALGALAVEPLLAALPKLGPFGLVNALTVLRAQDDARIAPALLARAHTDASVVAMLMGCLDGLSDSLRSALVVGIDEARLSPGAQLQLAEAMGDVAGTDARRKAIALQLADEPSVQRELGAKVGKWNVPWASEVFTRLRSSEDPVAVASATAQWLLAQPDIEEATALAAIQALDVRHRWWVARQVTTRYAAWAKVALLGLEGDNDQLPQQAWFSAIEWWRGGSDAALKLIELTKTHPELRSYYSNNSRFEGMFDRIFKSGWSVPPEAQAALASISTEYLVRALPRDDEPRALAAWRQLEHEERRAFVSTAVGLGLPWHRVVAAQLAMTQDWNHVLPDWIGRDWAGVPEDAAEELLALAKRLPKQAVAQSRPVRPAPGPATTSFSAHWLPRALVAACERTPELPSAILLTIAKAGDEQAWHVLAKRDPGAALELVRDPSRHWLGGLTQLLGEHGTAQDVPTLANLLAWHGLSDNELREVRPFLERHCRGNLDVADRLEQQATAVLLSKLEPAKNELAYAKLDLATAMAAGVSVQQLPELIDRVPTLQSGVVNAAADAMPGLVSAAQAPLLVQALDKALAREPVAEPQLRLVLDLLQRCAAPDALPAVRRALTSPRLGALVASVATTAIAVAGPQRRVVLLELLGASEARIVQVALDAEGVGQDQELLLAATNAMYAHGAQLGSVAKLFASLESQHRAATARSVVRYERFPQFQREFCQSIVRALGDSRDVASIPDLVLGARHPDYFVRMSVAEALGRMFVREAAPPLLEMLKDDAEAVRQIAKTSLDQLAEYLDARAKWDERLQRR